MKTIISFIKNLNPGILMALPNILLFIIFFLVPMFIILGYAFTPSLTFEILSEFSLENFKRIWNEKYYLSFLWSLSLALITTLILLIICYPVAYGLVNIFGKSGSIITLLFVMPLFVTETVKIYGWSLFFLKGGILNGIVKFLGIPFPELMYTIPIIIIGLTYNFLPFMLFPLVLGIGLIPNELRLAGRDLGATRLMVFFDVDLPIAKPGIIIGSLLTFVLSLSSMSESRMLGGKTIIMIADDIEFAFGYQQNWPLGSALSIILAIVATIILLVLFRWLNIQTFIRK